MSSNSDKVYDYIGAAIFWGLVALAVVVGGGLALWLLGFLTTVVTFVLSNPLMFILGGALVGGYFYFKNKNPSMFQYVKETVKSKISGLT